MIEQGRQEARKLIIQEIESILGKNTSIVEDMINSPFWQSLSEEIVSLIRPAIEKDARRVFYQQGFNDGVKHGTDSAFAVCLASPENAVLKLIEEKVQEARKQEREKIAKQLIFDKEDVHIFDTSYSYNQVRIDCVFLDENSDLWQALKGE